jgi:tRNA(fMet)-specific endonuclease VapC
LRGQGLEVGAHDLLIAATAVATGSVIVTRDLRSFPRIPDLDVRQW